MLTMIRIAALAALLPAWMCAQGAGTPAFDKSNPFYAESTLPFHAPPFDRIKDSDYLPAIEAGMRRQRAEVRAVAANPARPTFANTLVPLEKSGQLLDRAQAAFAVVADANTNPALQAARAELAPKLAAHHDAIYLNARLFARIAAIHRQRETAHLDPESRRLLEVTYDEFVRSGANLSEADKARLRSMNEEASTLSNGFSNKLLDATKAAALHVATPAALRGLRDDQLAAAAQAARARNMDGYVVPLQNTTQQPVVTDLTERETRRAVFENSWTRTERGDANDTRDTVARLAQLRAQRAQLLGYPNHAAWKLADQMAKTPDEALKFMDALVPAATAKAAAEGADIQSLIDAEGGGFKLEPWDWVFYAERVRAAKFGIDEAQVKPYFELGNVLVNGVFHAATQLYGITFTERTDIPVYQSEVRVFQVDDADGRPMALFYCDYFKRDNKNGGAWMSSLVNQSTLLGTLPVVYNVANLQRPAAGEPALISFEDVRTMFHEFGHALNGMFSKVRYPSLAGTATARDFVEFPSQFNEHWATYPPVFDHFARHYQTGEVMPAELIDKIRRSENADSGFRLTELLAAAELDMQWHMLPESAPLENPDDFERQALARTHLDLHGVPPRYRTSYFSHIWDSGYSAGYYAYLWTEMVADDAYQWFEEHGGLTRGNGDRFRRMILSRGNTQDPGSLYAAWRGGPPTIDAMLKDRGLKPVSPAAPR